MLWFEQEMSPTASYVKYLVPIWWHYLGRWGLSRDSASEDDDLGGYTPNPSCSFSASWLI